MTSRFKLHLKAKERVFINGAVLRVDRKVSIEMLNDVDFLLEQHVMQEEQATTALRKLYYVIQSMLMEPQTAPFAHQLYQQSHALIMSTSRDVEVLDGLVEVRRLIDNRRVYEAMKRLRALFVHEKGEDGGRCASHIIAA